MRSPLQPIWKPVAAACSQASPGPRIVLASRILSVLALFVLSPKSYLVAQTPSVPASDTGVSDTNVSDSDTKELADDEFKETGTESVAEEPAAEPTDLPKLNKEEQQEADAMPKVGEDKPSWTRLVKEGEAWIDREQKQVIIDGEICLREGPLEMFACPKRSKEHESIVAVHSQMMPIHAALLAIGAQKGTTAKFQPKYTPPTGSEIRVRVFWRDKDNKAYIAQAQDWMMQGKEKKPVTTPFVFAGSALWQDQATGVKRYLADDGDFICVANFTSAMLDVPLESTQANEGLMFRAKPERIPALGTKVRIVLTVAEKKAEAPAGRPK